MPYTKSLREIAHIIKSKPGYIIQHKSGYNFIVYDVDLDSDDYVMRCWKADTNGELKKASFQLRLIVEKELAFDDGVFISVTGDKNNQSLAVNSKSVAALEEVPVPAAKPISEHPTIKKALESHQTISLNVVDLAKTNVPEHMPNAVHFKNLGELAEAMDAGDHARQCSGHFWQITEYHNAVEILKIGFLSRDKLDGKMPSDAFLHNPDTEEVMSKNVTKAVTRFCRFHLRPRTDFTKAYIENYEDCDVKSFVYFSVSRKKIFDDIHDHKFEKPVLMTPYCAGSMSWEALRWKNQINYEKNLSALDFSNFNWENIYSRYDSTAPKFIKQTQRAEVLIADCLDSKYIDGIYFVDTSALERFSALLPPEILERFKPLFRTAPDLFFTRRSIAECL